MTRPDRDADADPDAGARFRAADPATSAWVTANAGAGKTRVLTERVARLLLEGADPQRILCLTFTKAAAAEMKDRLFGALGGWTVAPETDLAAALEALTGKPPSAAQRDRARRLFAEALETPGGLKIETIHAFCQRVLQRFPVEAGIAPGFTLLDERASAALLAEARRDLFTAAASDDRIGAAVALLAARLHDGALSNLIDGLGARRAQVFRALAKDASGRRWPIEAAIAAAPTILGAETGDTPESVIADYLARIDRAQWSRAAEALGSGGKTDQGYAEAIAAFLGDGPAGFDGLSRVFVKSDGEQRAKFVTKAVDGAHPWLTPFLAAEQERWCRAAARVRAARLVQLTQAMLVCAGHVIALYERTKAASGALDFDDLVRITRALLVEREAAAWVLWKLDCGVDHVLVDEAQDTSPEQWDIVRALTDEFFAGAGARPGPRTVFAVGDPKQSIYRFQGADPSAFGRERAAYRTRLAEAGLPFADETLKLSRRTVAPVLALVDQIFANETLRAGASGGEAIAHVAARAGQAGAVELWPSEPYPPGEDDDEWTRPVDAPRSDHPRTVVAGRIASEIHRWIRSGVRIESEDRPVTPGDILILVKRRGSIAGELVAALKRAGVPVAGADRLDIIEHIAVQDCLALARFALLPEDDLSLAEVLKSPLCGLDDDALFRLAHGRTGTLWASLEAAAADYPDAHGCLRAARDAAGQVPPFEFFARVLETGGRKRLLARLGMEAADPLDEFLSLALAYEDVTHPSLQGFLAWLEAGAELKRENRAGGEVRVMTVHGAKGLEAPIVILPDTTGDPNGKRKIGENPLLHPQGPLFPATKAEDVDATASVRQHEASEVEAEDARLLYVALTRARDRLVVCGWDTKRGRGTTCWYERVAAAMDALGAEPLALPWDAEGRILAAPQTVPPGVARRDSEASPPPLMPPAALLAPLPKEAAPAPAIAPSRLQRLEDDDAGAALSPHHKRRLERGILIHALVEALPALPPGERLAAAERLLAVRAPRLTPEARAALAGETIDLLHAPELARLFGPESLAEAPIAGRVPALGPDARVEGRIDRLLVTAEEVIAADIKTRRPAPLSPEETPAALVAQMALYRAVLEQAFPGRRITCLLLWTDGPRAMTLPGPLLDAALERLRRVPDSAIGAEA